MLSTLITAVLILLSGDYTGADALSCVPGSATNTHQPDCPFAYEDSPAVIRLLDAHNALGLPTVRRTP